MTLRAAAALLLGLAATALAQDTMRVFDSRSPAALRQQHAGRPYVLALWSIHCEPCIREMPVWRELQARHPRVPIVLVSTDSPEERARVSAFLARHDPGKVQRWQFGDEPDEKIRHAIDPRWRGELPRLYRFDAAHRVEASTGVAEVAELEPWFSAASRTVTR